MTKVGCAIGECDPGIQQEPWRVVVLCILCQLCLTRLLLLCLHCAGTEGRSAGEVVALGRGW